MYKLSAILLVLFVSLIAIPAPKIDYPEDINIVNMEKMKFGPEIITINIGESITWINKSKNLHNVVFPRLKKRSKLIRKGEKILFTFEKIGAFKYFCQPHKTMGMTGIVKVVNGNKKQIRNSSSNRVRD